MHRDSAADGHGLAGDVAGAVRAEEGDDARDVVRAADAAQRDPSEEMKIRRPQPRMPGSSSLVSCMGARRLTFHIRSQLAGSLSANASTTLTPAL
jgi:hypothetical protein